MGEFPKGRSERHESSRRSTLSQGGRLFSLWKNRWHLWLSHDLGDSPLSGICAHGGKRHKHRLSGRQARPDFRAALATLESGQQKSGLDALFRRESESRIYEVDELAGT